MDSVSDKGHIERCTTAVKINGRMSRGFDMKVGVHQDQGSVLSPVL